MNKLLIVLISMAISLVFVACGNDQPTTALPSPVEQAPVEQKYSAIRITVMEANTLVESGTAVFVDTRSAEQFADHHATGAILAPLQEISDNAKIPALEAIPLNQKLILYCT